MIRDRRGKAAKSINATESGEKPGPEEMEQLLSEQFTEG